MKNEQNLFTLLFLFFICLSTNTSVTAQCENWVNSPNMADAETAHVLYRQEVKNKNYEAAYENWKKAYELAPAADGKRPSHYADGRKILMDKFNKETDEAKKKELIAFILKLYDQQMECYGNEAVLLGFKAYDMFYYFRSLYSETMATLNTAVEKGGKNSPYTVLDPYATITVYDFTNNNIDKVKARAAHDMLIEIADHNINNGSKYAAQYTQAKEAVIGRFAEIKYQIFDCEYFKNEEKPRYDADPDNPILAKELYNNLKARGCDETDPFLAELKGKYVAYAEAENARLKAEFEANNPGMLAKKAYDAGDFQGAINKYEEAISKEENPEQQAGYYFSMASIQFRKLKAYSSARESARKAANLRSGWGRPYMLIGDMYATTSRNCGDDWGARLAVLKAVEMYQQAKSVDSEVASEANERIGKYRSSFPEKSEGFMRQVSAGQSVSVPCWIGGTVTVRFK